MTPQNEALRQAIIDYAESFNPTLHLTLQWDINHRTRDIMTLERRLYYFMSRVQKELLGRTWYRHHIQFIAFGEINASGEYHIHILIKGSMFTQEQWEKAFFKIIKRAKRTPVPKAPYLQGIVPGTEKRVIKYDIKQLRPDRLGRIDTSGIITSAYLFKWKKRGKQWKGQIL